MIDRNDMGLLLTYCQKDEGKGGDTVLKVIRSMAELPFGALMEIYTQSNRKRGQQWPQETAERRLALAEQEVYGYLRQCFFTRPGSRYFIWEEQGRAVCALRCETYGDGVLLTALETAPDCRGRGYAKALLSAVLEHLGKGKVYVHIRLDNQASVAVHRRCGFQKLKSRARLLDGSYSTAYDTYGVNLNEILE